MVSKKLFKAIVIGAMISILVGLLAACGGGNNPKSNNSGSNEPSSTEPSNTNEQESKEQPLEITWMRYEHPSQALLDDSVAIQEFAKRKNVIINVQSVPQSNYDDKKKTLIATNTMPDVLLVKQDDIQNFADSGLFLDLTDYLDDMPNYSKAIEERPDINKNRIEGRLFGFALAAKSTSYSGQYPMIRKDIIRDLGLKDPTTYDELYEVFKEMKKAYPDSYPFTARAANGLTGTENLINPIAFAFGSGYTTFTGTKVYYEPNEDRYKFGPDSDEFKEAIAWLHKLYKEKLLDPDYATATSQIWQEKLGSGRSFYFQDNKGFADSSNKVIESSEGVVSAFDALESLASPNGTKRILLYPGGHLAESFVINAKVKDKERVIEFMDWLYSEEGTALTGRGVEGVHYTLPNGEYQISEEFFNKHKNSDSPTYAIESELGTGYLGFGLYEDFTISDLFKTDDSRRWDAIGQNMIEHGEAHRFVNDPPFNSEEVERLKQIRTQIDPYLAQNMDKFIVSEGAIEKDWDDFVNELKKKGSEELVQIYNDALSRVVK